MAKGIVSLGPVHKGSWIIQASVYKEHILVMMFNFQTATFAMQYLKDEYEANLFVEYVLEKGGLYD